MKLSGFLGGRGEGGEGNGLLRSNMGARKEASRES